MWHVINDPDKVMVLANDVSSRASLGGPTLKNFLISWVTSISIEFLESCLREISRVEIHHAINFQWASFAIVLIMQPRGKIFRPISLPQGVFRDGDGPPILA